MEIVFYSLYNGALSGVPWVRKFGITIHARKFGYDVTYPCTLFAAEERKSGVSPSGGGVCYKSCDALAMHRAFFLAGNGARNGVANVVAFKNLFTFGTCFQLFHSMRIL